MSFRSLIGINKFFAVSLLSGACVVLGNSKTSEAMFGNKNPVYTGGARTAKITGEGASGLPIKAITSVIQDSSENISKRNRILDNIKNDVDKTGGYSIPRHFMWELLQYEPDKYKRDLSKGIRSYSHVDRNNDIKVKINVDSNSGDFTNIIVKTHGKRYDMDSIKSKVSITALSSKLSLPSKGEGQGEGTIKDVRPKVKGLVSSETKIKEREPKIYKPQENSQKLIDNIYETKGLNSNLLHNAIDNYDGDVESMLKENVYRFSGDNGNILLIYTSKDGKLGSIFIKNGDNIFEKTYSPDTKEQFEFYKKGYFEVKSTNSAIEKPIYKVTNESGDTYLVAKEKNGSLTKVLEKDNNIFLPVLDERQASIYGKIKEEKIIVAKNRAGEDKRVILEVIDLNGEKKPVAYQLDDGVWRDVVKSENGDLWLGEVIKYDSLGSSIAGKLRKLAKVYRLYGSLVVSGVSEVTGIIK